MAGSIFTQRRRSVFRHVLREDVPRRNALYQQRSNISNHRCDPVLFLQRIATPDRNSFLAQARVQSPYNFVLPEETHHAFFKLAVELHEIIQLDMLLPRQRIGHASLPFAAPTGTFTLSHACGPTGNRLSPTACSSSLGETEIIVRSKT